MLFVLVNLFFQYELVICDKNEKESSFNETQISEQLHQSLVQVNAFLKDIQHNIHGERAALRAVEYDDITTKDQDFLDYSLTDMWWNGSQATGANTAQTNFLPTHQIHGRDTEIKFTATPSPTLPTRYFYPTYSLPHYDPKFTYDTPISPPLPPGHTPIGFKTSYITRPTFPFSIITERSTYDYSYTGGPYPPGHPLHVPPSGPTPGPWTPDRGFKTTQTTDKFISDLTYPSSEYPTPSLPQPPTMPTETTTIGYPWPSLKPPPPTTSSSTVENMDDEESRVTATTRNDAMTIRTSLHPNISRYVQDWLNEMTTSQPVNVEEWLLTTNEPATPQTNTEDLPTTLETPLPNQHLDQNASEYLAPAIHRQGNPPPSTTPDPDIATATGDPWIPTATAVQGVFFQEDEEGFVHLGPTPGYDENTRTTILAEAIGYVPKELAVNQTSTIAGDVLYGDLSPPTPEDPYKNDLIQEMETQTHSYMLTYLIKLTELVASKDPKHVREVIIHAEPIITKLENDGRMAWFGEPLSQVTMNIAMFLSETEIDVVRSYSAMMYQMLKNRKQNLAIDVNSIIDYAELLYEDEEGLHLFEVIKEFDDYPNISKTSYDLADDLIEYFLAPYRRLSTSERRQALLDSVNYALKVRFPAGQRRLNKGPFMFRRTETPTTRQRLQNKQTKTKQKEIQKKNIRTKQRGRNYEKKIRRGNPTVHSEFNYENMLRRKYNLGADIFPQLRKTKPTTNIQKRFNIITPQQERFRGIMTRPISPNTQYSPYAMNLPATRRTTDYKSVTSNFFLQRDIPNRIHRLYQKQTTSYYRLDIPTRSSNIRKEVTSFLNEMKKRFMVAQAKQKAQKLILKAEVIKKIAEGSSYSDEEASLKMNLIDALLNRNSTTTVTGSDTTVTQTVQLDLNATHTQWNETETPFETEETSEDVQNWI